MTRRGRHSALFQETIGKLGAAGILPILLAIILTIGNGLRNADPRAVPGAMP